MEGSRRWWGVVVAALMAHNLEEHLRIGGFLEAHREAMPPLAQKVMGGMTVAQFDVSLVIATLLLAALAVVGVRSKPGSVSMGIAMGLGVGAGLFLNALQHTATSVYLGTLAPGVVTGWLLLVPAGVAISHRALGGGWITPKAFAGYSALGAVAMGLSLPAIHALSAVLRRALI
ncbi:MAG: HXXEE domain-containing protein [Myxococcales bacterium]